ncbi:bifunctional DNA-formamidopyrimidine glycosylase/DNA-(apurinic or apyrimidinic site) lyase [Limosilactobacillus sp. STM2_1]|uniref:Formamidopyrimidine-DNA glycosylase n=1 Tax=Limosilactobacillus rudii TaxID=2759755 RepID=A0A7W3YLU5_9LACO|nr:bifunctional DNA-formamidopyrimidine glycosylase/DNA-(apurinic or apyrimidinic site) lyase [Limosilactobacillus rudii]MBB1080089.1 bifunctional DNA-formamidopyrimidine glycosylase/DNA-(apurinic or apyrimidinic site) lyase [Limosilactobacillus rudii]MBB1096423.1 bifunctional DNA-formamidopyrimidine glycosylase/DNA-(apurinic or apyrimidinic site) lyase [Limosilactobacillus rudii]MCD7133576.1 bifunctional DNA-formamidopyrimidine glycosylase/DNA-(apurinic or apyrimidinic site) lyase [Limosilactob
MPELPEVETVRRGLMKIAAGRKINAIDVYYGKTITNDIEEFRQALIGQTIEKVDRRGKYLLFRFTNSLTMVSHLRMEGKYYNQSIGKPIDKHTHVVFEFTDGTELCYQDTRKFGRMTLVKTGQEMLVGGLKTIGPEPTAKEFTIDFFKDELRKSRGKIKPFLLNQRHVAGLGNIYVDEVLWMTGINPEQPANTLTDEEIIALRKNIIDELATAIKYKGTTVHSFTNAFGDAGAFQDRLNAYGHAGKECPRCGTKLVKIKVAERGTTFCPHCQPLRE